VDPTSGNVTDHQHPLSGANLAGRVLAIPQSRGSCTGSQVLLELLLGGRAPAAILLRRPDEIIALGVIVAEELFGCSLPVVSLGDKGFNVMAGMGSARVDGATVHVSSSPIAFCPKACGVGRQSASAHYAQFALSGHAPLE